MKKIFLILVILAGTQSLQAQSFKEKLKARSEALKAKLDKMGEGDTYTPVFSTDIGQDEIAKSWESKDYKFYEVRKGLWKTIRDVPVSFEKNTDGVIDKILIDGEPYKLEGKNLGFGKQYYGDWNNYGLVMDTSIIVLYMRMDDDYFYVKHCINKCIAREHTVGDDLIAYVKESDELINKRSKERANKAEADRKAKYGLEDKDVAKVEVKLTPKSLNGKVLLGQYGEISYNIVTTLKDGTVISTNDRGYFSDYKIYAPHAQDDGYDKIEPILSEKDVYQIDVELKKDPSIKASAQIALTYDQGISFNWSAYGGFSRRNGESARDVNVFIKQTTNTENGDVLLKVKLEDSYSKEDLGQFKIQPDKDIIIKLYGGDGGVENGKPTDGGNGGDVTVYLDPNVESYSLKTGLTGGSGGNGSYYKGENGKDGAVTEIVEAVNL